MKLIININIMLKGLFFILKGLKTKKDKFLFNLNNRFDYDIIPH